jgi:hypothetical protein
MDHLEPGKARRSFPYAACRPLPPFSRRTPDGLPGSMAAETGRGDASVDRRECRGSRRRGRLRLRSGVQPRVQAGIRLSSSAIPSTAQSPASPAFSRGPPAQSEVTVENQEFALKWPFKRFRLFPRPRPHERKKPAPTQPGEWLVGGSSRPVGPNSQALRLAFATLRWDQSAKSCATVLAVRLQPQYPRPLYSRCRGS